MESGNPFLLGFPKAINPEEPAMRVNWVKHVGYTTVVQGDNGEVELVLMASPGQDGRNRLHVVEAAVDGGMQILLHTTVRTDLDEADAIRTAISHWGPAAVEQIVEE